MEAVRTKRRKHHIIYKTTCLITGKWYIGLHSTDNLNDGYQGSGSKLWKSIKKYGKEQHKTKILEHCPDRETLIQREAQIVTEDMLAQELCMNLMPGGSAGPEFKKPTTEETLKAISENSKRMWVELKKDPERLASRNKKIAAPENVAKRAKANTGKKRNADQINNIKTGQRLYYATVDPQILKMRAAKGAVKNSKTWTVESEDGYTWKVTNLKKLSQELGVEGTLLYKTVKNRKYVAGMRVLPNPK